MKRLAAEAISDFEFQKKKDTVQQAKFPSSTHRYLVDCDKYATNWPM